MNFFIILKLKIKMIPNQNNEIINKMCKAQQPIHQKMCSLYSNSVSSVKKCYPEVYDALKSTSNLTDGQIVQPWQNVSDSKDCVSFLDSVCQQKGKKIYNLMDCADNAMKEKSCFKKQGKIMNCMGETGIELSKIMDTVDKLGPYINTDKIMQSFNN